MRHTYALEYGTDTIEIQQDAIGKGTRVALVDDLLATGGTMAAAVTLLESVGGVVPAAACIIELTFLEGRKKLKVPIETLLQYVQLGAVERTHAVGQHGESRQRLGDRLVRAVDEEVDLAEGRRAAELLHARYRDHILPHCSTQEVRGQ